MTVERIWTAYADRSFGCLIACPDLPDEHAPKTAFQTLRARNS